MNYHALIDAALVGCAIGSVFLVYQFKRSHEELIKSYEDYVEAILKDAARMRDKLRVYEEQFKAMTAPKNQPSQLSQSAEVSKQP